MSVADKMLKEIVTLAKKLATQEHENKRLWDSNMQLQQVRDSKAKQLRETEQELQRLRHLHIEVQSEDVAAARAEIETLRQQIDAARAETVEVRRRLAEEINRHNATHCEKIELFQQKESADKHAAELVKERDAALATVDLQRAGIELLSTCLAKIRQHVAEMDQQEDLIAVLVDIRSALAELDTGTPEPAPATEPKSNSSVTLTGSQAAEGGK